MCIGMNFVPGMTYGAEDAIETSNDVVERKGKGNFLFLFLKIVFSFVLFLAGLLIDAEADVENEVFGVDLAIGEEVDTVSEVPEVLNEIEVVAGPSNESREPAVAKKPRKTRNAQGIDLDVTLVGRERVLCPVNRHPVKDKLTFYIFSLFIFCFYLFHSFIFCFIVYREQQFEYKKAFLESEAITQEVNARKDAQR